MHTFGFFKEFLVEEFLHILVLDNLAMPLFIGGSNKFTFTCVRKGSKECQLITFTIFNQYITETLNSTYM